MLAKIKKIVFYLTAQNCEAFLLVLFRLGLLFQSYRLNAIWIHFTLCRKSRTNKVTEKQTLATEISWAAVRLKKVPSEPHTLDYYYGFDEYHNPFDFIAVVNILFCFQMPVSQ